eukprot:8015-Heterococcus_DN1.PRE.2
MFTVIALSTAVTAVACTQQISDCCCCAVWLAKLSMLCSDDEHEDCQLRGDLDFTERLFQVRSHCVEAIYSSVQYTAASTVNTDSAVLHYALKLLHHMLCRSTAEQRHF